MGESTDVFVIGGGPAGLAAAIAACRKGFRVTVADGAKPPIEKACGEGLMPDTLVALRELGISVGAADGFAFRGIRFVEGASDATARFPFEPGVGMRRPVLHQKMIDRAGACGVALRWETPVMGLEAETVILASGQRIGAKWIVGADGSGSRVRKWSGLDTFSRFHSRFAYRQHFQLKPRTNCVEVHWGRQIQAYMTPVSYQEICLTIMSERRDLRLAEALGFFPELRERLETALPSSTERGAITATQSLRRIVARNVALVGDASGGVDAITGEGLNLAFRQGIALADALEQGDLAAYQKAHRGIVRRPTFMARLMLLLGKNADLRRRVFRTLAADSELFSLLLSFHIGARPPADCVSMTARLGWHLISA